MRVLINSLLVLAICEPLFLDAKKVVVVMPRYQRRSQSMPWRQLRQLKKNGFANGMFHGQKYGLSHGPQLHRPKPFHFAKDQYPPGGDDFDQGHEEVNHVVLPHGKGITHAVSFGKGYIPYDNYDDHRSSAYSHSHNYQTKHPHQGRKKVYGNSYSRGPRISHVFASQSTYDHRENADKDAESRESVQDAENNGEVKSPYDTANSPTTVGHFVANAPIGIPSEGVFPSSGVGSAGIGGGQREIVLRDSIVFDDYNKKVAELTKKWPASFGNGNHLAAGSIGNTRHGILPHQQQLQQSSGRFGGFSGINDFVSNLNQRGYEVKEDVVDAPHDFRTMPIRTAPEEAPSVPHQHIQYIHQPVQQQSLQHIFQQPTGVQPITLNYGIPNSLQGYLHG